MKVVNGLGKYAIVEGLRPVVMPVGSLEELETAAEKLEGKVKEEALTAIDIYKTAQKLAA